MSKFSVMIACMVAMGWALPSIADEPAPASLNDSNGVWQIAAQIRNGRPLPEGDLRGVQITLDAGKFVVRQGDSVLHEGTSKLVAVQDGVRKVVLHFTKGEFANQTLKQIAVLERETLISCLVPAGQDWPTEFASTSSNGGLLTVYKRCQP